MFDVVLYQPEIPPNTGNVLRLAANVGARLHLVRPLGFSLHDRALARAGLDYAERVELRLHADWAACLAHFAGRRIFAVTTCGDRCYDRVRYAPDDVVLFGSETGGLPPPVLAGLPAACRVRLPMRPGNRSLNLSNAVAIVLYEAWRQQGFRGADGGFHGETRRAGPAA
jgi:tRNA (cytidine/uridine-2'-O-)-methyltransferase